MMSHDDLHDLLARIFTEVGHTARERHRASGDTQQAEKEVRETLEHLTAIHDYLHPEGSEVTVSDDGRCPATHNAFRCVRPNGHSGPHQAENVYGMDIPEGSTADEARTLLRAKAVEMATQAGQPVLVNELNVETGEENRYFVHPETKQ